MNNRRQRGEIYQHQEVQGTTRSRCRKPPPPHGSWQPTVPSWEKRFCYSVGSIPWRKLLETKKIMYLYENVVQWNDSAGEEAFHNAKSRFWAEINGLPCNISLPDPDIYIDQIDWNSNVDPELVLDLEREPKDGDETSKREEVVIIGSSLLLNQPYSCAGWGEVEEEFQKVPDLALDPGHGDFNHTVTKDDIPWEKNVTHPSEAINEDGWGNWWNDSCGWGNREWEANNDQKNVSDGTGGHWGTWDGQDRKRAGAICHMSRYKTSRFQGDESPVDRGMWRHGRGRRRSSIVVALKFEVEATFLLKIKCLLSPGLQSGEMRTSDLDSDQKEIPSTGTTPGSTRGYEASKTLKGRRRQCRKEHMMKWHAAALAVPTNDMAVRTHLHQLVSLYSFWRTGDGERRDRLRMLMARLDSKGKLEKLMKAHEEEEAASTAVAKDAEEEMVQCPFYTEGSKELLNARIDFAKYSIPKAGYASSTCKEKRDDPDEGEDEDLVLFES
ncbi:hypothetical protein OIU77_017963 [Salix suchowensis]|uniref:Uncharacterized protein n=1 Tax=Salix suchowensis TaxID=1278906 RepID=A0ABQ8ZQU6_9ROSI|nr:hypothetical protein OIU77_017963 [Salix suchowensis]